MHSFLVLITDSNFAGAACNVEQFMGLCAVFFGTMLSSFIHSAGMCQFTCYSRLKRKGW